MSNMATDLTDDNEANQVEEPYVSPDVAAAQAGEQVVYDMTLTDSAPEETASIEVFPNEE